MTTSHTAMLYLVYNITIARIKNTGGEPMEQLIIIGGGPAGVSAALYGARAGLKVTLIENGPGALAKAHRIDNYYGVSMSGAELHQQGLEHAARLGAAIIHDEVVGVEYLGHYAVSLKSGAVLEGQALILATGTKNITLKIPGLTELEGKGISYCAVCDGFFFRKKKVAVLGAGAYALHEAEYLKQLAETVTILTHGQDGSHLAAAGFEVIDIPLAEINGEEKLSSISFYDGTKLDVDGLFIALGTADSSDIARKLGAQINGRYIQIDENGATNVPGLFAAGDCTGGLLQVAKAVHDGAKAGMSAVRFIRSQS